MPSPDSFSSVIFTFFKLDLASYKVKIGLARTLTQIHTNSHLLYNYKSEEVGMASNLTLSHAQGRSCLRSK